MLYGRAAAVGVVAREGQIAFGQHQATGTRYLAREGAIRSRQLQGLVAQRHIAATRHVGRGNGVVQAAADVQRPAVGYT